MRTEFSQRRALAPTGYHPHFALSPPSLSVSRFLHVPKQFGRAVHYYAALFPRQENDIRPAAAAQQLQPLPAQEAAALLFPPREPRVGKVHQSR